MLEAADRHFNDQAMDIEARDGIDWIVITLAVANRRWLAAQGEEIKDLQIDPEGIIGLTGVDLQGIAATVHLEAGAVAQRTEVGGGFAADVDRGCAAVVDQGGAGAPFAQLFDGDELTAIPIRPQPGSDRPGIVEEGVGIADFNAAGQLIGEIRNGIAISVHMNVVNNAVAPFKVVGAAFRAFKGNPTGRQHEIIRVTRRNKDIGVGVVSILILRNQWRFAMAGSVDVTLIDHQRSGGEQERCQEHSEGHAHPCEQMLSWFGVHTISF